jgi:Uma2 family endonuclease
MYDLPSEHPEEPGLPDEYHYLQPQLLSATLKLSQYSADQIFSVGDMNLYYDVRHPNRYKRPDWFAVAGVSRLYGGQDLRLSYVIWQEGVVPTVVVELLSPGTEKEDLGQTPVPASGIPTKWQVYEQILRVPYYVVFDRYRNHLQAFQLVGDRYQPLDVSQQRVLIPAWERQLVVWQGNYGGSTRSWLRWADAQGELIPTSEERAQALAQRLRDLGVDPDDL